jgi:hypothetical protein
MGSRHHYVPRFYLSAFQSAPRRIDLLNIKQDLLIHGASLRDQCYGHKLYGNDGRVEAQLAVIETAVSPVLREMRESGVVPGRATAARSILEKFLALQLARTIAARDETKRMFAAFDRAVFEESAREEGAMSSEQAMALRLSAVPETSASLSDLALVLLQAPADSSLVTSDNPAFRYNQYCEGILHRGVEGLQLVGFQLFFPLGPSCLLMAYDSGVYKIGGRRQRVAISVTKEDVDVLNGLQLISASENVYFSDAAVVPRLRAQLNRARKFRPFGTPRIVVAVSDHDPRSELVHQYTQMPQLSLALSCVRTRREARRVRDQERGQRVRPAYYNPPPPGAYTRYTVKPRR